MSFASTVKSSKKELCTLFAVLIVLYLAPIDQVLGTRLKARALSPVNKVLSMPIVYLLLIAFQGYLFTLEGCMETFICLTLFFFFFFLR